MVNSISTSTSIEVCRPWSLNEDPKIILKPIPAVLNGSGRRALLTGASGISRRRGCHRRGPDYAFYCPARARADSLRIISMLFPAARAP
jgi:hypothetical protein